jgi:hypothetical protein
MKAGMVIGLGGMGVSVVHRIRTILTNEHNGAVPEHLRLLAFDIMRPSPTTGRLGQPFYFLVRLPVSENGVPATRQAARQILLNDLQKGVPTSLILRALALNIDALLKNGYTQADVFIVSSTFGISGSAWLVDMAYLCRQICQGRLTFNLHAVLLTPETCQASFDLTITHRMTNFVVLKELESFHKPRDWSQGYPIYGGKRVAGLPGLLTTAPFSSLQVIDAQSIGGKPEQSAVPAAAEGILCQMDEQAAQILRQAAVERANTRSLGKDCFSTLGVHVLTHPSRLLVESGVQRALLGILECLFPLRKEMNGERPIGLEPPPDSLSMDIAQWLGDFGTSGVLTDLVFHDGLKTSDRQVWLDRLSDRDIVQWQAVFYQVDQAAELLPIGGVSPETEIPFVQGHFRAFLRSLGNVAIKLESDPTGTQEFLAVLVAALSEFIADLDEIEAQNKRQGRHSTSENVRRDVEQKRRDWENKQNSSWSRVFPQRVTEAKERYLSAKQLQVQLQQHESIVAAVRKATSLMLDLARKLVEAYPYFAQTLALAPDSLYNLSMDRLQHAQNEIKEERGIRCQQIVIDENFEERQIHLIFEKTLDRFFDGFHARLRLFEDEIDWQTDAVRLRAPLDDPASPDGVFEMYDLKRTVEETVAVIYRSAFRILSDQIWAVFNSNPVLNFLGYLHPHPERLAAQLIENSQPMAKTLIPPDFQTAILYAPKPKSESNFPYLNEMLIELRQQIKRVDFIPTGELDRVVFFRRFDGLNLDNLATMHASLPERIDPAEIRPFVLWVL